MALFSRKKQITIHASTTGQVIVLEKVNDPVFSQKIMGDGFAIVPETQEIYAPMSGVIESIFPTKHAIVINQKGVKTLIHIGIDTVELEGKGFELKVKVGDKVTAETLLAIVDFDYLKSQGKEVTTMILFPELADKYKLKFSFEDFNAKEIIGQIES